MRSIGPPDQADYMAGMQFANLYMLGLRAHNTLLDFGCGELRLGRLLIQYLDKGNFFWIEPEGDLIRHGKAKYHLSELAIAKEPRFEISAECNLAIFGLEFDYIIAQSVFTHMPKNQIVRTLASAGRAMHRGSLFVANYKEGKGDYLGKDWTQANITYRPATMQKFIEGCDLVSSPQQMIHTTRQEWLLIRK